MKQRLDKELYKRKLVASRSQAESFIKLGMVTVNAKIQNTASFLVDDRDDLIVTAKDRYVSRAGLKLASVAHKLSLDFRGKLVLDVGSSTGGFTDYALQQGAEKVIAVDVGTNQLHQSLRTDPRVELHEQTDIRTFHTDEHIDIVVIDVSFISLRDILPSVLGLCVKNTLVVAMLKPQFEAGREQVHKGVIKNDHFRRDILKNFELWVKQYAVVINKADSEIAGAKGNLERFFLLAKLKP